MPVLIRTAQLYTGAVPSISSLVGRLEFFCLFALVTFSFFSPFQSSVVFFKGNNTSRLLDNDV